MGNFRKNTKNSRKVPKYTENGERYITDFFKVRLFDIFFIIVPPAGQIRVINVC